VSEEVDELFDFETQEAARKQAAKDRERYENQLDTDYLQVMQTHAGRRIVWDIVAPIWRISFTESRNDTDFREGERNVALRVWARLVRVMPALAHKLLEENQR
jgi:hypothetical protein